MSMLSRFIAFFTQDDSRADQKGTAQIIANIATDIDQEEREEANDDAESKGKATEL